MNAEKMKRKLVAILSADVNGYSRLMSVDEEATVRMLSAYKEIMGKLIPQFGGRVVDAPGDNLPPMEGLNQGSLSSRAGDLWEAGR